MKLMRISVTFRLVAIALLLVGCAAVFSDCHGSCADHCDSDRDCPCGCRCAVVNTFSVNIDCICTRLVVGSNVSLPQVLPASVFRPPVSLSC